MRARYCLLVDRNRPKERAPALATPSPADWVGVATCPHLVKTMRTLQDALGRLCVPSPLPALPPAPRGLIKNYRQLTAVRSLWLLLVSFPTETPMEIILLGEAINPLQATNLNSDSYRNLWHPQRLRAPKLSAATLSQSEMRKVTQSSHQPSIQYRKPSRKLQSKLVYLAQPDHMLRFRSGNAQQFKVDIRNAPIPEEGHDVALANVASTLRMVRSYRILSAP